MGTPERDEAPHTRRLREQRQDVGTCTYFLRVCTRHREPILAQSEAARLVVQSQSFAEAQGWLTVMGYVVMPDHWHAVWKLGQGRSLACVMQAVKRWTASEMNKLLGRTGPVWQEQYYEHLVRSGQELEDCLNYMSMNPVRAGLAEGPGEYAWVSVDGLRQGGPRADGG